MKDFGLYKYNFQKYIEPKSMCYQPLVSTSLVVELDFLLRCFQGNLLRGFVNYSGVSQSVVGLYRKSRLVAKSRELSKSGLSRNRTFSFPDAGLLKLLTIKIKIFFFFKTFLGAMNLQSHF